MLTTEDIQKLSTYLKEDLKDTFVTKGEFSNEMTKINTKLDLLTNTVDSFAKEIKDNRVERVVTEERLKRVEEAVKLVAKHTGITVNV
jgi:hypothetical protein